MTPDSPDTLWVNDILDRSIRDPHGTSVGTVDNLELTRDGGDLYWTAVLCGPSALGPRLGGHLGTWWASVGARLRPDGAEVPRIPLEAIVHVDRRAVTIGGPADTAGTWRLRTWVHDHVIAPIPGSGA